MRNVIKLERRLVIIFILSLILSLNSVLSISLQEQNDLPEDLQNTFFTQIRQDTEIDAVFVVDPEDL